jgi:hypothetical protein
VPAFAGSEVARTRSRVAVATRCGSPEEVAQARRDHAAARLEDFIRKTVDQAPPLTSAQRDRLTTLLLTGGAHDAAA